MASFLTLYHLRLGDVSDADSEARDFSAGITKFKDDVRNFRASQISDDRDEQLGLGLDIPGRGPDNRVPEKPAGRTRGFIRGPRKAAEPSGDIKLRLSRANEAFISGRYEEARIIILEIIRINAETYEAWTVLSAVFQELGRINDAVMALIYAAHLRPKNVAGWLRCAQFAQEETGEDWKNYLPTANFCYSSALRADSKCIQARLGKANIYLERNKPGGAISEFKHILKVRPHDLEIVRRLASSYIDNDEVKSAKELYKEIFAYLRSPSNEDEQEVTWNDVNAYITLYEYLGEYTTALVELKSLSRWLLGRESEDFWDEITVDDREWDTDNSRRAEIQDFDIDRFPLSTYGDGLPLELRIRMGLCRLNSGHNEEALVSTGAYMFSIATNLVQRHIYMLKPSDRSEENQALEYSDLYLQVAPKLLEAGLYQDALAFYQSLKRHPSLVTPLLYIEMGKCFQGSGLGFKAEDCFQMAIQMDDDNVEARMELAKMYEHLGEQEQAFIYVNEVMSIKRSQNTRYRPGRKLGRKQDRIDGPQEGSNETKSDLSMMPTRIPRTYKPRRLADPAEKLKDETARAEQLQSQYYIMRKEHQGMRNGDGRATNDWMDAARDLTDDFRSFKLFYPWDKYVKFLGYTGGTRALAETPLDSDLTAMAERLSRSSFCPHFSSIKDVPTDVDRSGNRDGGKSSDR
jgi:general transcription factor 3C polypeptide 3 (transcription factor C subunit 4)